ncbi:MAG: hypothetical protein JSV25_05670 [Spirochaetota bacterium]|nr:MAG: hypothetical protein JSV25_05670 [Spirochaetota bacterium]
MPGIDGKVAGVTGKLTVQAVFLNRGKYEVKIKMYYCLYTIQELSLFHKTIP